jgi:hypothetical protein
MDVIDRMKLQVKTLQIMQTSLSSNQASTYRQVEPQFKDWGYGSYRKAQYKLVGG